MACKSQPKAGDPENTNAEISLSQEKEIREYPLKLVLENPDKLAKEHLLSEIASEIEYIPLETNQQSLIRNMKGAWFTEGGIYVHTPNQLMLFDSQGKFLRNIGKKGRGPEEYQQCSQVAVDFTDGSIWVYDVLSKALSHYDQTGSMRDRFTIPAGNVPADGIVLDGEGSLVMLFTDMVTAGKGVVSDMAKIFTVSGELLGTIPSTLPKKEQSNAMLMMPNETMYVKDKEVYIKESRNDTLYRIDRDGKHPHYIIAYPAHKMPLETFYFNNDFGNKYIYMQRVVEGSTCIFLMYRFQSKLFTSTWNLKDNSLAVMPPVDGREPGGYTDDLKYGATIWPRQRLSEKEMLAWIQPLNIPQESLQKMKTAGMLVNADDNPVLQRVVLK
jgi:hypothetical protein